MTAEETQDMHELYSISPALTCECDEVHVCQQCYEQNFLEEREKQLTEIINFLKIEDYGT
jgi:hypothetical protein